MSCSSNELTTGVIAAVIGAIAGALGTAIVETIARRNQNEAYIKASLAEICASLELVKDFKDCNKSGGIDPGKVNMLINQLDGVATLCIELRRAIFYSKTYAFKENYEALSSIAGGCPRIITSLEKSGGITSRQEIKRL